MTSRVVTLAGFAVLAAAGLWWSALTARRPAFVTLPRLLARAMGSRAIRIAFALAWAWVGWHLFARGSGAFE